MQMEEFLIFKIKVKNMVVFFLFLLIFLTGFKADYFNQIPLYNRLESPLRLLTTLCIFLYIFLFQRGRSYKISILCSMFLALMYGLDLFHNEGFPGMFFLSYVAIFMFVEAQLQDSYELTVRCMAFFLGAYIVLNLFTIIIYPNGLFLSGATRNPCYLLGHRNTIVKYAIPMITICSLWAYMSKKKYYLFFWGIYFAINLIAAWRIWSGSAMISLAAMFGVMMIGFFFKRIKSLWMYLGALAIFVAISIFRLQEKFAFIIEGVLHKDISMTGRTDFWDIGLTYIKQNLVLGGGKVENFYLGKYILGFTTLHSFYLDMLFRGGLLLFLMFWLVILIISHRIDCNKDIVIKMLFLGCMGGYLCVGLVEPIADAVFILMFVVLIVGYWATDWSEKNEVQCSD